MCKSANVRKFTLRPLSPDRSPDKSTGQVRGRDTLTRGIRKAEGELGVKVPRIAHAKDAKAGKEYRVGVRETDGRRRRTEDRGWRN